MTTRVAIYARVSTVNHGQDVSMQTRELRQFAQARGWNVAGEYIDAGVSGAKDSRPELNRLMADAHKRRFDVCMRLAIRQVRALRFALAPGARNLPGAWNRLRFLLGADGHCDACWEDGLYRPGRRGRVGAQPNRGTRPGRSAKRTCQGEATG
jgi:hypothetical protein